MNLNNERNDNKKLNILNKNLSIDELDRLIELYKEKIEECTELLINEFDIKREDLINFYGEKYFN
ncbi:hypothetical protein HERIO_853 [Hepatospora eriocheir]|uniref:Uncharacterized protein n=1 Tax=Hepatospora eriocheir TaxID=1081669 RepID=A0A1X0QBY7_9MICR|nr:hypothetical protein HERIO_853 [Hepatospora eriocheir]